MPSHSSRRSQRAPAIGRCLLSPLASHGGGATRRGLLVGAGAALPTAALVAAGLVAAGGALAATGALGGGSGEQTEEPKALVRRGMVKFREDDVEGSVADFDAAMAGQPSMRPYLWQRGLSLYYVGEFEEGARQFRDDVAVNPNDTEESIWAFLCEAQLVGPDAARKKMLKVGRDSRTVMRAAQAVFEAGSSPQAILDAAAGDMQSGGHDAFYSQLVSAT
ncbi:hypothetical protein FOA52_002436 [Chlamydomonas sp. UWO 241]|nr:hypothetical protein FOA52_002436 [Chlamydomonas sp. UWO 241]